MLDFSAILLSWKRKHNIEQIVSSLKAIPHIKEILIWNNDQESLSIKGATVFNSPNNYKCPVRHCIVPIAKNDNIWIQDDDVLISPEQFSLIESSYELDNERIYGCCGRLIKDGKYILADIHGEVDIILGYSMMFHKKQIHNYFKACGVLPSICMEEDDIVFSLFSPKKPFAVDVGVLTNLGTNDSVALCHRPNHYTLRQNTVNACLSLKCE